MQDALLVLSDNQEIKGSAPSTNFLNEEVVVNTGYPMIAETRVRADFKENCSLMVEIQASNSEEFEDVVVLGASGPYGLNDLKKGKVIRIPLAFNSKEGYCYTRAFYTVAAAADGDNPPTAFTGGAVDTVIQPAVQTNMEG